MRKNEATPTRTIHRLALPTVEVVFSELSTCKDAPSHVVNGVHIFQGQLNLLNEKHPPPASVAQDTTHG